jgi:hypothetical protein
MPLQVPARHTARPRKQRIHTRLLLRIVEHEYGLAIFLRYSIVRGDGHLPEAAAAPHAISKHNVIERIGEKSQTCQPQQYERREALQEAPDFRAQHGGHGVQL